jgi:hypothetical protein
MHGPTFTLSFGPGDTPGTVSFTVSDHTGRVVGAARLTAGSTWQLTALHARSRMVFAALCHGVLQTLRVNGVRSLAVSVDTAARERLADIGLIPTGESVAELLDRQRRLNPEGYRLVTLGDGLDDVRLPHPAELLTALAGAARELAPVG